MTVKSKHDFRMSLIEHVMLNPVDDWDVMFDLVWVMMERCQNVGMDFAEVQSKAAAARLTWTEGEKQSQGANHESA